MTIALLAIPVLAVAQATSPAAASPEPSAGRRAATTTPAGDAGLWFVPTSDMLPAGRWSVSAHRVNADYDQGFTDVSHFTVTWAIGIAERGEIFGAWSPIVRIDRDVRPLFATDHSGAPPEVGGVVNEYPFAREAWSGNRSGDLWLGGKFGVSEGRAGPGAVAVRGMVKVPTATRQAGTGRPDFAMDLIASNEADQRVELAAFSGVMIRGDPPEFDLLNGIRWGFGLAFPTRRPLRLSVELQGEKYLGEAVKAEPGLLFPRSSPQKDPLIAAVGLTWLASRGLSAGVGFTWNLRVTRRSEFPTLHGFGDETGDALGVQVRIGYHPGVRLRASKPRPHGRR